MVEVANSTVKRRDVAPVMKGPVDDTGEEPLCLCRWIRQNWPCHGCSPTKKSYLDFVFPSALERFRQNLLIMPAGCDVCCVLQCSSDGQVRSPVRRPDKRAVVNSDLRFRLSSGKVCDQMTLAPRLLGLLLHWERRHTHICVREQQRWYQPAWIAKQ